MRLDESLRHAKVTAAWLDAADVGAAAKRRKRRKHLAWTTSAVVAAVVVAGVLVPTLSTSSSARPARVLPTAVAGAGVVVGDRLKDGIELVSDSHPMISPDPAAAGSVATSEQALSVALLQQLDKSTGGAADLSVSPASLAIALAMLQNGAAGKTLTQIQTTLHSTGLTTEQQNAGIAALTAAWQQAAADDHLTLDSANSLFLQRGFPVQPGFLTALKSYYDAGTWQVDFADQLPGAIETINAWTAQQTHGKITKLFEDGQLDASTVAVLANAVYFHAAWSQPFDPAKSHADIFEGSAGQSSPMFMTQHSTDLPWAVGDGYQAVQLPYTGGRFAALAVMPTTGSLSQFIAGLTPDRLAGIVSALHTATTATVELPRFTTTSTVDLSDALAALGMPDAFEDRADFSALSPHATQIQAVEQRVYLAVGEKGTEAAATTGVAMTSSGYLPQTTLTFNHPFLFAVRDTVTGAIMFASLVQNPTN